MRQPINDGRTKTGRIDARPGVHAELNFVYRLAENEAVYEYQDKVAMARTGREKLAANAAFAARHLVSWDRVQGDAPEASEPTEANVRRLHHLEINGLINHLTGWASPLDEAEKN